jgi:two-component system OmpR family response regulator
MKVLIIDDDPEIRLLAVAFLSGRGGMTVLEAGSGEEGVALAERESPDVILLDAVMTGMDGPATLAALRGRATTASIPVIFLTGLAGDDERQRLEQLGACGVLTKPFKASALGSTVLELLATRDDSKRAR